MDAVIQAFHEWDEDGGGTIEKEELEAVMHRISPQWGPEEINDLMNQIDTNGDGVIDLDEFVSWLTDPTAKQTLHKDGWFGSFDLRATIKPLYDLFDRSKSGVVTLDDFKECHTILRTSLQLHPCAHQDKAMSIAEDAETTFQSVDKDGAGHINFEQFCHWQGEVMRKSGIPNSILPDVIEELVSALSLILDIDHMSKRGQQIDGSLQALQDGIAKLASTSRQIYADKNLIEQSKKEENDKNAEQQTQMFKNTWIQPAPDDKAMLVLVRQCASDLGVTLVADQRGGRKSSVRRSTGRMTKPPDMSALPQIRLCIPCMHEPGVKPQTWLAQVKRMNAEGKAELFIYEYTATRWKRCEDEGSFKAAFEGLRPWVRVYSCLLAATMGKGQMNYQSAICALDTAVELGLLRRFAVTTVGSNLKRTVTENMDDYEVEELAAVGELEDAINAQLSQIEVTPSDILNLITGAGVHIDAISLAELRLA